MQKRLTKNRIGYIITLVMDIKENLFCADNRANKCKHVSLTHWFRKHWISKPKTIYKVLEDCYVSPYIGCLPPELIKACKNKQDILQITRKFRIFLDFFIISKYEEMRDSFEDCKFDVGAIGRLFDTDCQVFSKGSLSGEWRGAFAFVCKMSFPKLNANYALKIFYTDAKYFRRNGAFFEVPVALNSYKAEPKNNNKVYMASFSGPIYILSKWAGDNKDGLYNFNKNEIFYMHQNECSDRNFRQGKRIDFGDTFRTAYGAETYHVRKLYRKILALAESENIDELHKIFFSKYNYQDKKNLEKASSLVFYYFMFNGCSSKSDAYFTKYFYER